MITTILVTALVVVGLIFLPIVLLVLLKGSPATTTAHAAGAWAAQGMKWVGVAAMLLLLFYLLPSLGVDPKATEGALAALGWLIESALKEFIENPLMWLLVIAVIATGGKKYLDEIKGTWSKRVFAGVFALAIFAAIFSGIFGSRSGEVASAGQTAITDTLLGFLRGTGGEPKAEYVGAGITPEYQAGVPEERVKIISLTFNEGVNQMGATSSFNACVNYPRNLVKRTSERTANGYVDTYTREPDAHGAFTIMVKEWSC